jgi:tetratricopeptide (TPR) repeat protein
VALSVALLVIAAVYLHAAFFEFAYDDFGQIVQNPQIKSWILALGYFKSHVWAQTTAAGLYYRPVFMLWLAAQYKLFGLNPVLWHLTVIALHVLCCVLLYFFACRLTRDKWVAVIAVLLFGLHPAHVESVAWISGATEPLLAVLLLGSLLCYLKHRDSGQKETDEWQAASLLLACLAVLAKETALITPALIFSYEWIFHQRDASRKAILWSALREAIPYAVISLVFLVVRTLALSSMVPQHTRLGFSAAILAWPKVVGFYFVHGLFPFRLSVFYNLVVVTRPGLWNFVLPLILLLAGASVLLYGSRRSQVLAFLSAWCAILLLPMLNVTLWNNAENIHDRYLYLPSVAICVMLASLLSRLKELGYARTAAAVLIVITVGYTVVTVRELGYWQNDYILALRGVEVSPGHPIAPQLVGNAFIRQGRITEAIPYLVDALQAQPDNIDTLCSLGFCYATMNDLRLAEECITRALAVHATEPQTHLLLGIVRLKQRRLDEAEAEIRRGTQFQHRLTPGNALLFHGYLGDVLYAKGDLQGAMSEYRLELRNEPSIDPAAARAQERLDEIKKQYTLP